MSRRIVILGYSDSVHVTRWAQGLAGRGYSVRVVSLGGTPIEGVETITYARTSDVDYLWTGRRARKDALAFRPDLVHVMSAGGYALWSLTLGFDPTVVTVFGSEIVRAGASRMRRFLAGRAMRKAKGVTAASHHLAVEAAAAANLDSASIDIVPFGVQIPDKIEPLPPSPPVKLCVIKQHTPVYGLDVLIDSMTRIVEQVREIELDFAGDGPLTDRLSKQARDLGLENHIRFVGSIPNSQVGEFLGAHHMMIMPSREESFGVAALEAGACGRPVIASNVGGIPEAVADGKSGILVPPEDPEALAEAILSLARDRERLEQLGQGGREHVAKHFAWELSLDRMLEIYDSLIG